MFDHVLVTRPPRMTSAILIGSAATLLSYYGFIGWAGWPAIKTLQIGERLFSSVERGLVLNVAFFAFAVVVNVVAWAIPVNLAMRIVRSRRR